MAGLIVKIGVVGGVSEGHAGSFHSLLKDPHHLSPTLQLPQRTLHVTNRFCRNIFRENRSVHLSVRQAEKALWLRPIGAHSMVDVDLSTLGVLLPLRVRAGLGALNGLFSPH